MEPIFYLVIFTTIVALIFDAINGFHDAANSIATIVSTRVLSPRIAVLWAAFFNFVAMLIFEPRVADTISKIVIITPSDPAFVHVVMTGLFGAIVWDLLTWWWGLPVSSSHALIGGIMGAGYAHAGWSTIRWEKIISTVEFIFIAPIIGLVLGFINMAAVFWIFRKSSRTMTDRLFRKGQLLSAALYSIGHGGNDAQKTMGIIMALLLAGGMIDSNVHLSLSNPETAWIILSCNAAMAIGTAMGGWRIVKTLGMKITKLRPEGGFCAETAGAFSLFLATYLGVPVSTTHTITGAIIGVGATTSLGSIKWSVSQKIVLAWIITIPFSAIISGGCFYIIHFFYKSF